MTIYIVRHGETEENLQAILQGHMPGTLTEKGKAQVRATALQLAQADVRFTRIVTSDLKRAMDSARFIADELHIPIIPMEILRERDTGGSASGSFYRRQKSNPCGRFHPRR